MADDSVLILGSLLIDDVVRADGTAAMGRLGGAAPYAAAGAALAGARPVIAAWVGHDAADVLGDDLRSRGLDPDSLLVRDAVTPRAWQLFEADGTRTEVFRTPWAQVRQQYPAPEELPTHPGIRSAYVFAPDPRPYARELRARGTGVVVWEAPDDLSGPDQAESALSSVGEMDAVAFNAGEWERLLGVADPHALADLALQSGCPIVAVRLGSRGALLASPSGRVGVPAEPARPAVDFTGAGNAFCGALAAGLRPGEDDPQALARLGASAVVAAAMTIEAAGVPLVDQTAREVHRARVQALLQRHATRDIR